MEGSLFFALFAACWGLLAPAVSDVIISDSHEYEALHAVGPGVTEEVGSGNGQEGAVGVDTNTLYDDGVLVDQGYNTPRNAQENELNSPSESSTLIGIGPADEGSTPNSSPSVKSVDGDTFGAESSSYTGVLDDGSGSFEDNIGESISDQKDVDSSLTSGTVVGDGSWTGDAFSHSTPKVVDSENANSEKSVGRMISPSDGGFENETGSVVGPSSSFGGFMSDEGSFGEVENSDDEANSRHEHTIEKSTVMDSPHKEFANTTNSTDDNVNKGMLSVEEGFSGESELGESSTTTTSAGGDGSASVLVTESGSTVPDAEVTTGNVSNVMTSDQSDMSGGTIYTLQNLDEHYDMPPVDELSTLASTSVDYDVITEVSEEKDSSWKVSSGADPRDVPQADQGVPDDLPQADEGWRRGGGLASLGFHFRRPGDPRPQLTLDDFPDSVLEGDGGTMDLKDVDYQNDGVGDDVSVPAGVTLAFVFDSTGSMHDDLTQVMHGTQAILNTMLRHQDRPIYNYVLVPFHDPAVGPVTVTTNHSEFNNSLKAITVRTGGDCPEMSLGGIKLALEESLPSSYIYVFTDASAKDYMLLPQVLALIQRKKSQVVFVLTGDCGDNTLIGYQVYEKIAATSSGQVFHLNKTDVEEVLTFVRLSLQTRRVNLLSVNKPGPSRDKHNVYVDRSLKEFTVSVSGKNPSIGVEDPGGNRVEGPPHLKPILTLETVKVVKVQQPDPGQWKVWTGSDSQHTVRSTGRSEMNFEYGFSTVATDKMHETYHRPLKGAMNNVLVQATEFVDLHNLTLLRLVDLKGNTLLEIPLHPTGYLHGPYRGNPFVPPADYFYIEVTGLSKDGYPVKRITATAISSQKPALPIVSMKSNTVVMIGKPVQIKCYVESLVPFTVMWFRAGELLKPQTTHQQTSDVYLELTSPTEASEGNYTCRASNVAGSSLKETMLTITGLPPEVSVPPRVMSMPGQAVVLNCSVDSELHYTVSWARIPGNFPKFRQSEIRSLQNDSKIVVIPTGALSIDLVSPEDEGWYMCKAKNKGGVADGRVYLSVREPLRISVYPETFEFQEGNSISISCRATGTPEPILSWKKDGVLLEDGDSHVSMIRQEGSLDLVVDDADEADQGQFQCEARNEAETAMGQSQGRYVEIPMATVVQDKLTVKEGDLVTLQCIATGVPTPTLQWSKGGKQLVLADKYEILGNGVLRIASVQLSDAGEFTCIAQNRLGSSKDFVSLDVGTGPQMVQAPSDTGVDINKNGTIPCMAVGHPLPRVSWQRKDGRALDPRRFETTAMGNLHITDANMEDAGTYVCVLENAIGKLELEADLKITGIVKPVVDSLGSSERDVTVGVGATAELPCHIVLGNPWPTLAWYKDGEVLDEQELSLEGATLHPNGSLTIGYVTKEHEGAYECVASNVAGLVSKHIMMHVVESPNFMDEAPSEYRVRFGEEVRLPCDVQGDPKPLITWEKDGLLISTGLTVMKHEDDSLVVQDANEGDSGTYVCTAVNSAGTSRKAMAVFVQVPPTIGPGAEAVKAIEGQIVTLTCEVTAIPPAQIKWLRDGVPLANTHKEVLYMHRNTSIWFVATSLDSGTYKCVASNEAGTDERVIMLTVLVPPNIYPPYEEFLKANLEQKVTFDCQVFGSPPPAVVWQKNGEDIANITDIIVSAKGTLTIPSVQSDSAGVYVCDAENDVGISQKLFYLMVNVPPKILENLPPHINLMEGEDYFMPCTAQGIPRPEVSWRKDGHDITPFDRDEVTVQEDGTLLIHSATQDHSGLYTCTAENHHGSDRKNYVVDVLVPPSMMEPEVTQLEVTEGDSLVVACPAMDAVPPPQIEWLKDGRLVDRSEESRLLLKDHGRALKIHEAHLSDRGTYSCVATNLAGRKTATFTVDVLTLPHFPESNPGTPNDHEHIIVSGMPLVLTCSVSGHPKPRVSWKKNGHPITPHTTPGVVLSLNKETLKIPSAKPHDSGMYQCSAINKIGSRDQDFQVEVIVPPELEGTEEEFLEAIVGDPVLLQCPMSGLPEPHIRWSKDGSESHIVERPNLLVSRDSKILDISNIHPQDGGIYICEGSNNAGSKQKSFNVSVLEPPVISDSDLTEDTIVKQGDNATLVCEVHGQPLPDVTWLHNGRIIKQNSDALTSGVGEHALELADVQVADGGKYTCMAANMVGVAEKNHNIKVLVAPRLSDRLEESDTIQSLEGLPVMIRCPVVGSPMPDIHWMKDSQALPEGEMLYINKSRSEHSGNYTCVAQNHAGNVSKSFQLDVYVPPSISAKEEEMHHLVRSNSTLTLHCNVSGHPHPNILWLKGATPIMPEKWPNASLHNYNKTLVIPNVSTKHSGKYSCLAINMAGTTELTFSVEVQEPPVMSDAAPTPHSQTVKLHRRLVLKCPLLGSPQPIITWYKDDVPLENHAGSNVHISSDGKQLHLMHAQTQDAGAYTCVGQNPAGSNKVTFQVAVTVPAEWSRWSTWSDCSTSCGPGEQNRVRECGDPDAGHVDRTDCQGDSEEWQHCHMAECQVHGGWGEWSDWTSCSESCGRATRRRYRKCDSPIPAYGGQPCLGSDAQQEYCRQSPCPIHGNWSEWSAWGSCSVTCDNGVKHRTRQCNNPPPMFGGKNCTGLDLEVVNCNSHNCPEDGGWSEWGKWRPCSASCGPGMKQRMRACSNPKPRHGGADCNGENMQIVQCIVRSCDNIPIVAALRVKGKLNGENLTDSMFAANISDLGHRRTVYASINDILKEQSGWFPYLTFMLSPVSWNTAFEEDHANNGYSLTQGHFEQQSQYEFATGEELVVTHKGHGLDTDGTLRVDIEVNGEVPIIQRNASVVISPYEEDYVQTSPNSLFTSSTNTLNINGVKLPYSWNNTVSYDTRGTMPYLVEKLSTQDISTQYDPRYQEMTYMMSTVIGKKYNNRDTCPDGFTLDQENMHCRDIDECIDRRSNRCHVTQVCENLFGTYRCFCRPGYKSTAIGKRCTDINECAQVPPVCSHRCRNTKGSFKCLCRPGFTLMEDGQTCSEVQYPDYPDSSWSDSYLPPIQKTRGGKRRRKVLQAMLAPEELWKCPLGFEVINGVCQDTDECAGMASVCSEEQTCLNTRGSFRCLETPCPEGYDRDPDTSYCLLYCDEPGARCDDGAKLTQTVSYVVLTPDSNTVQPYQDLMQLSVHGEDGHQLPWTRYRIVENEAGKPFRVRFENSQGVLYSLKQLTPGRIYRVAVLAVSYDGSESSVLYTTKFIVFIHLPDD